MTMLNTNLFEARLVGGPKHGSCYKLATCPERIVVPSHSLRLAQEFAEIVGDPPTFTIESVTYERDPDIRGYHSVVWYYWVPKSGEQLHGQGH